MKDYNFYIYILTNWNNKVMYIGVTNNLERRLYEHTTDVHAALARERNEEMAQRKEE